MLNAGTIVSRASYRPLVLRLHIILSEHSKLAELFSMLEFEKRSEILARRRK